MFELLIENDKKAHQTMVEKFDKMLAINIEHGGSQKGLLIRLQDWHKACASNFEEKSENFLQLHSYIEQGFNEVPYKRMFAYFAKQLDLEMGN
jgi:hypothetical protein